MNNQGVIPENVKLISTERFAQGGKSSENFKNFNLAFHVDDNPENVLANRSLLRDHYDLPSEPVWINQTHSSICINASLNDSLVEADASFSSKPGIVCAILTADCLPVFIFKKDGTMVGIAHAGWRGLVSGVIESLTQTFDCDGKNLHAHLGPAISINAFEVGEEIKTLYLSRNNNFSRSFSARNGKNYLDLYDAAKVILEGLNISSVSGGGRCTFEESSNFFSYRRDGVHSGRMAHLIWMS